MTTASRRIPTGSFGTSSVWTGAESGLWVLPSESDLSGRTLAGRYKVELLLGEGGDARVYRASQWGIERPVALKVLRSELRTDRAAAERLWQEARTLGRLHHPNAIAIHDVGETDLGLPFVVLELLAGRSLAHVLDAEGALPPQRAIDIMLQLVDVLESVHAAGLVHQDLKPDNIFLERLGRRRDFVKLIDFGAARAAEVERDGRDHVVVGTATYMSPEHAMGHAVDARSDVYSLGVLLYELVSGNFPFRASSPREVMMEHLTKAPPPLPESVRGRVPNELVVLLEGMLRKEPVERPQTCVELRSRLRLVQQVMALADAGVEEARVSAPPSDIAADGADEILHACHLGFRAMEDQRRYDLIATGPRKGVLQALDGPPPPAGTSLTLCPADPRLRKVRVWSESRGPVPGSPSPDLLLVDYRAVGAIARRSHLARATRIILQTIVDPGQGPDELGPDQWIAFYPPTGEARVETRVNG